MTTLNLLYKKSIPITSDISIVVPTVGEILDNEDEHNDIISSLTAMPIDMMVQLDDVGIDFSEINAYDLFILMFRSLKNMDTKLVFGDLDLTKFDVIRDDKTRKFRVECKQTGVVIDRAIHTTIASTIRKIYHLEQNRRRPANQEAKEYMIHRAREKMARRKNRQEISRLESLIIAMVNTEQFKYNYEQVGDLTIYQFNESVYQIIHKVDCEHKLNAVYAGTLSPSDLSQDELNWLSHK